MEKKKVLAILNQEELKYELKAKLTHEDVAFLGFVKFGEIAMEKVLTFLPDAVVLVSDADCDALQLAKDIYIALPGCAILLMEREIDLAFVEMAMLSGVRKVLPVNCKQSALIDSINLACMMERSRNGRSDTQVLGGSARIITVFGSKGGIGKSTIVSNLSIALARRGKRVAVLDLDLQFGDINLFFDVDPKETIAELVQETQSINYESIKSYMQFHSSTVSLLCAPKSPEMADSIKAESVEKIINTLRSYFDYIVIDSPPYFNDISIAAMENSDEIMQIVTLDISTLRNTKISLNIMESLQLTDKISIVVNRDAPGLISHKDAQSILGFPLKYKIPSDWKTAIACLNRGIPIVSDAPKSAIAKEFLAIADMIAGTGETNQKKGKAGK